MGRAQAANQGRDAALQLAGGPLGGLLLGIGGWAVGVVMTLCHAIAALTAWMLGRQARRAGVVDTGAARRKRRRTRTTRGAWWQNTAVAATDDLGFGTSASAAPREAERLGGAAERRSPGCSPGPDLGGVLLITTCREPRVQRRDHHRHLLAAAGTATPSS